LFEPLMSEPKREFQPDPLAAVLAYLIPGAGHLYQRRYFKGVLYLVCILGTFFYGAQLGEWKVVYFRWDQPHRTYGYLLQGLVGLPALPAYIQSKRYEFVNRNRPVDDPEKLHEISEPLSATFTGRIRLQRKNGDDFTGAVTGRVALKPVAGDLGQQSARGTFSAKIDGKQQELKLGDPLLIGPQRFASEDVAPRELLDNGVRHEFSRDRRYFKCNIVTDGDQPQSIGVLEGTIPRGFFDRLQVPLEDEGLQDLHGRLGKHFEIALVYTWIAGLLNILAMWDAYEGPAYGYGDEKPNDKDDSPDDSAGKTASTDEAATPATEAAEAEAKESETTATAKVESPPPSPGSET
jgi:hypothetical protein